MEVSALFNANGDYISRLFSYGAAPLEGWTEWVADNFSDICEHFGDNSANCFLRGEAKWMWVRFTPSSRAIIKEFEFAGSVQVTMIRVHRKRSRRLQVRRCSLASCVGDIDGCNGSGCRPDAKFVSYTHQQYEEEFLRNPNVDF